MVYWAERQRSRYRQGRLELWKKVRLDTIGFPYVGARYTGVPSNVQYAQQLVAFWREHGHYAPTNEDGGPGLTRWVRLMRESAGRSGLIAPQAGIDQTADLEAARQLLQAAVPDFEWALSRRASLNRANGLSRSGKTGKPRSSRKLQVVERARAAAAFPPSGALSKLFPSQFVDALLRSMQACRCRLYPQGVLEAIAHGDAAPPLRVGYLVRAAAGPGGALYMHVYFPHPGGPPQILPAGPVRDWRFVCELEQVILELPNGTIAAFDYDVGLDDALERIVPSTARVPSLYEPDWPRAAAGTFVGRITAGASAFPRNIARLASFLRTHPDPLDRHISRSHDPGFLFNFLQHQVWQSRHGELPMSHARQLRMYSFTFGAKRTSCAELFDFQRTRRLSEYSAQEIEQLVAPRKPGRVLTGNRLDVACSRLSQFVARGRAQGLDILVSGEDRAYYFRQAHVRDGLLHISYSCHRIGGQMFGTMLGEYEVRGCRLSVDAGLTGFDIDGEPIRIFATTPGRP